MFISREPPRFHHWLWPWLSASNCSPALWLWPSAMRNDDTLAGIGLLFVCGIKGTFSIREEPRQLLAPVSAHPALCCRALSIFYCACGFGCVSLGLGLSSQACDWTVQSTTHAEWEKRRAGVRKETELNTDKINSYSRTLRGHVLVLLLILVMKNQGSISQLYAHLCEPPPTHSYTHLQRERENQKERLRKSDEDETFEMYLHLHLFITFV